MVARFAHFVDELAKAGVAEGGGGEGEESGVGEFELGGGEGCGEETREHLGFDGRVGGGEELDGEAAEFDYV